MTATPHSDASPSVADLARYLDGEMEPRDRASLEVSLEGDPSLASSLAEMEAGARAVRAWASGLPDHPLPAPPDFDRFRPVRGRRLIAAGVVLLVGTGVLVASPAGATLIQGLRAAAAWVIGGGSDSTPPATTATGEAVRVSAHLEGTRFSVEIQDPWPAARLRFRHGPAGSVSASAPPGAAVGLLFLREGLVVSGQADPGAELMVTVPPAVEVVEVVTSVSGSRTVQVEADRDTVIELPMVR